MPSAELDFDPLRAGVSELVTRVGIPLAFGGDLYHSTASLRVYAGVHGQSIRGLHIEAGEGLGGRVIAEKRPRHTSRYEDTRWITHRYAREVRAEGIVTLVAVPIVVSGDVRALLYAGFRESVEVGNETATMVAKIARRIEWEYSVREEVARQVEILAADQAPLHVDRERQAGLRESYAELRHVASIVEDPELRVRLEAIGEKILGATLAPGGSPRKILTRRETDVLALAALGDRNARIASRLGLTENSVKKYISNSISKLGATNRLDAVVKARRLGCLP